MQSLIYVVFLFLAILNQDVQSKKVTESSTTTVVKGVNGKTNDEDTYEIIGQEEPDVTDYFFAKGQKTAVLPCSTLSTSTKDLEVVWGMKDINGQEYIILHDKSNKYSAKKISKNQWELTIQKITNDDMSRSYFCAEKNNTDNRQIFDSQPQISIFTKKQVENFDNYKPIEITKSAGIRTTIDCTVIDRSWEHTHARTKYEFFSIEETVNEDGSVTTEDPIQMDKNTTGLSRNDAEAERGIFEFPKLTPEDSGLYECVASNKHGKQRAFVRVQCRSALAALWPFLGCAVQVLIVSVILFIFEKRKLKKDVAKALADAKNSNQNYDYNNNQQKL